MRKAHTQSKLDTREAAATLRAAVRAIERCSRRSPHSRALLWLLLAIAELVFGFPAQAPAQPASGDKPAAAAKAKAVSSEDKPEGEPAAAANAEDDGEEADAKPAEEDLLYERAPFDRIVLNDRAAQQEGTATLDVDPLELPNRRLPTNPKPNDKLRIHLPDQPGEDFELRWGDIKRIELFEEMVLAQAQRLIEAGRNEDAFATYQFLDRLTSELPIVRQAIENYLFADAQNLARQGQLETAQSVLIELAARNPQYPRLERALVNTTSRLMDTRVAAENWSDTRRLWRLINERYPKHEAVGRWQTQLATRAGERFKVAEAEWQQNHRNQAIAAAIDAVRIWPALPNAATWLADHWKEYPRIVVGVTQLPAAGATFARVLDFGTLRRERLLNRHLLELTGFEQSGEGAVYTCPFGQCQHTELGRGLSFRLTPDISWSDGGSFTGHDVASDLLEWAEPASSGASTDWMDLLSNVRVRDIFSVDVQLRSAHVRPDSLLDRSLTPWHSSTPGSTPTLGPYLPSEVAVAESRFDRNERYFASAPDQPHSVIERWCANGRDALDRLADGRLDMLDRVNPWEVNLAAQIPGVHLATYALPTVHMLILNFENPWLADRSFRRALEYGIHRQGILTEKLLHGRPDPSCQVLSAPLPVSYAYNTKIAPRGYDPRLALALIGIARQQMKDAQEKQAPATAAATPPAEASVPATDAPPVDAPAADTPGASSAAPAPISLRLAHGADEVATMAATEIQRHLKLVKIEVELRALEPGAPLKMPADCDMMYVELPIAEPLTDARKLLGIDGLAHSRSPYLRLVLRQLDAASDWPVVRQSLEELHTLLFDELPVIPLWQTTNHFAYRDQVEGIGEHPVSLYQNIEQWKAQPWMPADSP